MRIGIPKERKTMEGRVALTPSAVSALVSGGHTVFVESEAGLPSGHEDVAYELAGARVCGGNAALYEAAELIVKVKEPVSEDLKYLRRDHLLFCYLHLAADRELTRTLLHLGLTAIAFETVQAADGSLPLLTPMSAVAGNLAVQLGAQYLTRPYGGKGLLLGGVAGTPRGKVVVLGGGVAGLNAARRAAGMGAEVVVFDRKPAVLERLRDVSPLITTLSAQDDAIRRHVASADLLVGAVLVPGAEAPKLVRRDMVSSMEAGSVIVDIAIDQGGCVETIRPTSHDKPSYVEEGVIHIGVTNLPGAVPSTSTEAISSAILPYVQQLASVGWRNDPVLANAVNVADGRLVHPVIAEWFARQV